MSLRACTPPLTPSLSSTAIPGDPYDHHLCAYHAACCAYRRRADSALPAALELRRSDLLDHRRHRGPQQHPSLHPLNESPPKRDLRPCVSARGGDHQGLTHPVVVPGSHPRRGAADWAEPALPPAADPAPALEAPRERNPTAKPSRGTTAATATRRGRR